MFQRNIFMEYRNVLKYSCGILKIFLLNITNIPVRYFKYLCNIPEKKAQEYSKRILLKYFKEMLQRNIIIFLCNILIFLSSCNILNIFLVLHKTNFKRFYMIFNQFFNKTSQKNIFIEYQKYSCVLPKVFWRNIKNFALEYFEYFYKYFLKKLYNIAQEYFKILYVSKKYSYRMSKTFLCNILNY